jgi:hypothetical protein
MTLSGLHGGFGDAYSLDFYGSYTPTWSGVEAKWNALLADPRLSHVSKKLGWDFVRLAFYFKDGENLGAKSYQLDVSNADGTLTVLDSVIGLLSSHGFKVNLCSMNYTGRSPSSETALTGWINDWKALAAHYAGDSRIAFYQIGNEMEPFVINEDGSTTQENTLEGQETLNSAMAQCTDAIRNYEASRTVCWCPELNFDMITAGGGMIEWRSNILKDNHRYNYKYEIVNGKRVSCTSDSGCSTGFYCTPEGNGVCAACFSEEEIFSSVQSIVSQRAKYAGQCGWIVGEFCQIHSIGGVVGACNRVGSYLVSLLILNGIPYDCFCFNENIANFVDILEGV